MTSISGYPIYKNMVRPAQTFQNSKIYNSNINYEGPRNLIYTRLNQNINLLNKNRIINYSNRPINKYQNQPINATYGSPILSPMKVLPTKYLPVKVITEDQQLNATNYTNIFPLSSYYTPKNNVNIISSNNIMAQTNTYYNNTATFPVTNISYTNEKYNANSSQTQNISPEYITSFPTTSNINYADQYDGYKTKKETENFNCETIKKGDNYENKEYFINSDDNQDIPQENLAHSYILNSPVVKKKFDIFSEIQSPISNYETQSYNGENVIYRLENEILNLKAENEQFKKKLNELDRYKSEAAEARILKEQLKQLSPLIDQKAEIDSLKAQLAELNELKMKVKELENLRIQIDQINSQKKKKFKSLKKVVKSSKKEIEPNTKISSVKESKEKNTIIKSNINKKNISFEEKIEKAFVNGDIIHNVEELEMLVRKMNKSSQKMTINLIYKATADSDKAEEFHKKCDKSKSTLILIETNKGKRFGGYTSVTWEGNCIEKLDEDAFIFSLDKKKIYENIHGEKAIGCYPKYGPVFLGCQIRIYDNAFQRGGTTFEKELHYNTKEDYELTDGDREFKVKEIEVYEIIAE